MRSCHSARQSLLSVGLCIGRMFSCSTAVRSFTRHTKVQLSPSLSEDGKNEWGHPLPALPSDSTHTLPQVMHVKEVDLFAVTRINNYLKRHSTDETAATATLATVKALFRTQKGKDFFLTTLQLPVRVFVNHQLTNTQVQTSGYGATEKLSLISCCMHAEWCLDALSIPVFASAERQRQRRAIAEGEGRHVPHVDDAPRELTEVVLPLPVDSRRVPSASIRGAHRERPLQSSPPTTQTAARRQTDSAAGDSKRVYAQRFGVDSFTEQLEEELATLRQTITHYHAQELGEIELKDISVLAPAEKDDAFTTTTTTHIPRQERRQRAPSPSSSPTAIAVEGHRSIFSFYSDRVTDETEGGAFQLVEVGDWHVEPDEPGAICLYDAQAPLRLQEVYARVMHVDVFVDCVTVHTSEEENATLSADNVLQRETKTWYTASAPVLEWEGITAVGKGTTLERAQCLCAMHAESVLQCLGVPLFTDTSTQIKYYEACLKWGRVAAPAPVAAVTDAIRRLFPKPLKEWYKPLHSKWRGSPLTVTEKLVALNRRLIETNRLHFMMVDICDTPAYQELFRLCMRCLAVFMQVRQHPYEGAYVVLEVDKGVRFRCSLYVPLPQPFGVRGGSAFASTPTRARQLTALHAIDVLCAVDYIPAACRAHPQWEELMALRASLHLTVPASWHRSEESSAPSHLTTLRSPPCYIEDRGRSQRVPPAQEVWRIMLLDARAFDVAPPLQVGDPTTGQTDAAATRLFAALPALFERCVQYLTEEPGYIATHRFHYSGAQHYGGVTRMAANNVWMRLPLPVEVYGVRVAVGRCQFLRQAERHFYFHFFRMVRLLGVAPWDAVPRLRLVSEMYNGDARQLEYDLGAWDTLERIGVLLPLHSPELVAAMKLPPRQRPSPNPVMSSNLRNKMFTSPR